MEVNPKKEGHAMANSKTALVGFLKSTTEAAPSPHQLDLKIQLYIAPRFVLFICERKQYQVWGIESLNSPQAAVARYFLVNCCCHFHSKNEVILKTLFQKNSHTIGHLQVQNRLEQKLDFVIQCPAD